MTDENDFALCLCVSVGTRGTVSNVYGKSDHTTVISLPEMLQSARPVRGQLLADSQARARAWPHPSTLVA